MPVRVVFLDRTNIDYNARTPHERPMGGTQSGVCYLSAALARRGHHVALATHTTAPGTWEGVECVGRTPGFTDSFLRTFDAVVVVNGAIGLRLRKLLPNSRLVLWSHHAHDQAEIAALAQPGEADAWDGLVTLSEWQTRSYVDAFGIPRSKLQILRNGIAPAFAAGPAPSRGSSPTFAYTSTPFRGLRVLLDAWPAIRAAHPSASLRVFSSMAIYGPTAAEKDRHGDLYERCRATPGVDYAGIVPQKDLAAALSTTDALLYPSTFAETSCIAVLEALAAGCRVYTTRTAALPETGAPWAKMLDLGDRTTLARRFADLVIADLRGRDPESEVRAATGRAADVRGRATWDHRAADWEGYLARITGSPR